MPKDAAYWRERRKKQKVAQPTATVVQPPTDGCATPCNQLRVLQEQMVALQLRLVALEKAERTGPVRPVYDPGPPYIQPTQGPQIVRNAGFHPVSKDSKTVHVRDAQQVTMR